MENLNAHFWEGKYSELKTGWDIGYISTPLKEYFDQLTNKELSILIPGAGNAYEAQYLHELGFSNVYIVDWAKAPLDNFKLRVPTFPQEHIIQEDYFKLEGQFDIIVEQTFFCALNPDLRADYVKQSYHLLKPKGKLIGLYFNIPLNDKFPPFGGNKETYLKLFEPYFTFKTLEISHNSIEPRKGSELFVIMIKKINL